MTQEDELDFMLASDLPEIGEAEHERLEANNPRLELWPLALEFEDEGAAPSELQPMRTRLHGRREEILAQHASPLRRGDVFDTELISRRGDVRGRYRYRLLGRTKGTNDDWAVVERFELGAELPPLAERKSPGQFRWTLRQGGREVDEDSVEAYGPVQALELALAQAFDGFSVDAPSEKTANSMRWDALAGGTTLTVESAAGGERG